MFTKLSRLLTVTVLGGGVLVAAAGPAFAAAPVVTLQTNSPQAVDDATGRACTSPNPGCDPVTHITLDTYASLDAFANGVSSDPITVTASPYQNINLEECKPNPTSLNDCDAYTQLSETLTPDSTTSGTSFHGTFTDAALYVEPSGATGDGGNINCDGSHPCVVVAQKYFNDFVDAYGISAPFTIYGLRAATTLKAAPAILQSSGPQANLFTLSATLTSAAGQPLANQPLNFTAGYTYICTATTNATGTATCNGLIKSGAVVVAGGYDVAYAGNATNQPASAHAALVS